MLTLCGSYTQFHALSLKHPSSSHTCRYCRANSQSQSLHSHPWPICHRPGDGSTERMARELACQASSRAIFHDSPVSLVSPCHSCKTLRNCCWNSAPPEDAPGQPGAHPRTEKFCHFHFPDWLLDRSSNSGCSRHLY